MFYAAKALLEAEGIARVSHSGVVSAFGREFARPARLDPGLHRWLLAAQQLRNVADYDPAPGITDRQATEVIERARVFIDSCGQLIR